MAVGYYQRKLRQMYRIFFIEMDLSIDDKMWGVLQHCVYETKICDICNLQKRLVQARVDFGQNVVKAAFDQWREPSEIMCACWWQTL